MRWSKWETEFSLSTAPIKCDFNDDDDDLTRDFKNLSALSLNTILQVYGVASLISVPPHYLIRNLSEIMTVVAHFVCVFKWCSALSLRNTFVFYVKMYNMH